MLVGMDDYHVKIYADPIMDACTACPFWLVDTQTLETGCCFILNKEVPLDEKTDAGRMPDCPIILRSTETGEKEALENA